MAKLQPAVFLTAASRHDKDLVAKVKKFVQGGGRAIATSGLLEALGDKGFQDIAEIRVTSQRVIAKRFSAGRFGFGGGGGGRGGAADAPAEPELNIVLPKMLRFENDNRLIMPFTTAASGYPMAVSASYGQPVCCENEHGEPTGPSRDIPNVSRGTMAGPHALRWFRFALTAFAPP